MPASTRPKSASRLVGTSLAVAALAATLLTAPPSVSAVPVAAPAGGAAEAAALDSARVPRIAWEPCGPQAPGFGCATVRVPLDYDRPGAATITLALTRLRATDPQRRIGSLFLNPGGPGGSGVGFVQSVGNDLYSPRVRARFDLIGFDPRGVAASTTLQCFDTTEQALAVLPPFPFPYTRREEGIWNRAMAAYSQGCVRRAGAVLDHMSTANVARDMDLLRRAVGDRRLSFVGYSYGSYIGSTYANMFPGRVRAVVIDGVIDPVAYATGRGNQAERLPIDARLQSEQGAYRTLLGFWRLCDRGGATCAFSGGDPQQRYERLARRLLAEPARLPDGSGGTVPFTYQDLVSLTLGVMYAPDAWPEFAEFLQELDLLTRPERAAAALRTVRARLGLDRAEPYGQVLEGFAGVWCSDGDNPDDVGAWARSARAADRRWPYFGRAWIWFSSICATWPGEDVDRYAGPFDRRTANDVLVVGTRRDPATRYKDAVTTERMLPRAQLLTLNGWGHTSLFKSTCVDRWTSRYLLTGQVPPRPTECRPDVVPFARQTPRALTTAETPQSSSIPSIVGQPGR